jgi:hypothetical protein
MNTTACATKWATSSELDNGPSSAGKIGERPPVFREPEADAKPKLNLFDRPVYDLLKKTGDVTELRILDVYGNSSVWKGFAKGTVTGLFDNHAEPIRAVSGNGGHLLYPLTNHQPPTINTDRVPLANRFENR